MCLFFLFSLPLDPSNGMLVGVSKPLENDYCPFVLKYFQDMDTLNVKQCQDWLKRYYMKNLFLNENGINKRGNYEYQYVQRRDRENAGILNKTRRQASRQHLLRVLI